MELQSPIAMLSPEFRPSAPVPSAPSRTPANRGSPWCRQVVSAAGFTIAATSSAWRRRIILRQGVQDKVLDLSELEQRIQEMQSLRVRELRARLESLGLSTQGRVDRESLVELLETEGRRVLSTGHSEEGTEAEESPPPESAKPEELPREVQQKLEELRALKARDLRKQMIALGLNCEGRVDKESLLELLEEQGADAILHPPKKEETKQKKNPFKDKKMKKPPVAAQPKAGSSAEARIFLLRGVSDYGLETSSKVITIELEVGMSPLRFVVDTACYHSVMKESLANNLFQARFCGAPDWAQEEAAGAGIRQIALSQAFLAEGKIACGEVKLATIPGELPIPIGTAGILGLDFLALFDWDFDVRSEKVRIATAPKDRRAPVQFDVDGMVLVPLTKIRTPSRAELYACSVKVVMPGDDVQDAKLRSIQGLPDLASSHTMCNKAAAKPLRKGATVSQEKAQKKSTGFGSGLTVKESKAKKRSSSGKTPEELPATFGIGKGPRLAVRQGAALAGDLDPFEELKLTEWPTVILGADVLAQERLVFSFRQNKMWMTPGTGSSVSATPIDV